jgi:hypothetical protein
MGSAVSTPPADDAALTAEEVKALIGEEKFDQAKFDQLAGEGNTTITFAQLKVFFWNVSTPLSYSIINSSRITIFFSEPGDASQCRLRCLRADIHAKQC